MRLLSLGVVAIVWLLLGYFFYQQKVDCCLANSNGTSYQDAGQDELSSGTADGKMISSSDDPDSQSLGNEVATSKASGPILYNYSSNQPILGDEWADYKANLLKNLKDDQTMEITGNYTKEEKAPSGFSNMGEARADEARKALGLSKEKVLLKGVLTDSGVDKDNPYKAVSFKTMAAPKSVDESIPNKTVIRFPYNSTNKLSNREVEDYLDKLARRVKTSGEKVKLTGYTDSDGSSESNVRLGQRRAEIIKRYLIGKGVNAANIITLSKGEADPIASNSTKAGMAQNRRTEVEIIN